MTSKIDRNTEIAPRPVLVTLLAILTIVGIILGLGFDLIKRAIPELSVNDIELPLWLTIGSYAMSLLKFIAAILLLRMRRIGFFMYAIGESIAAVFSMIGGKIGMDYLDTSYSNPDIPFDPKVLLLFVIGLGVGLSIVFIGGYGAHLSKMK